MSTARSQAARDRPMRVEIRIAQAAERTPAWRKLWRRLLAPADAHGSTTNHKAKPGVTSSSHDRTSSFS